MTDQYARTAKGDSRLDKEAPALPYPASRTGIKDGGRYTDIDRRTLAKYARRMRRRDLIAEKLTRAFSPLSLEVMDESHLHEGHAGHRPGGETHFRLNIVAAAFEGKSRIARHRMINEVLAHELASGVHALAIHALAPEEVAQPFPPRANSE